MDKIKLFRKLIENESFHLKLNSNTLSMSPLIYQGDYIYLNRYDDTPHPGDIILAYYDKGEDCLICHRVVKCKNNIIYTKGDNNYNKDYYTDESCSLLNSYIATVTAIMRGKHYIDLTTNRSRLINKLIARVSVRCVLKKNPFLTELNFSIHRIEILLLQLLYKRQKNN
jgi:signal peptidase I